MIRVQAHIDNPDARIANRIDNETFRARYPRQVEHILRLTAERLQNGMRKDIPVPLGNCEVMQLARALRDLHEIYQDLND